MWPSTAGRSCSSALWERLHAKAQGWERLHAKALIVAKIKMMHMTWAMAGRDELGIEAMDDVEYQ